MTCGPFVVGSTYDLELAAYLDGSLWDLSGATVVCYIKDPSGNVSPLTTTLSDDPTAAPQATAQIGTSDLDVAGTWTCSWKVALGGTVQECPPITFRVVDSP